MRLPETLKSLGRRWYVLLIGLALTGAMAYIVDINVPTTYEATGSVLLMPPLATVGENGNPYLYLGGLNQAQDVLVRRANAPDVVESILVGYPETTYTVQADRTTSTPFVVITTEADTGDSALQVRDVAIASVIDKLKAMQDESDVKDTLRIQAQNLVIDTEAIPKTKAKLQLLLIAVGGGIIGTLLLVGMLDGWLIERKALKSSRTLIPQDPPETEGNPLATQDAKTPDAVQHASRSEEVQDPVSPIDEDAVSLDSLSGQPGNSSVTIK